MAPRSARTPKPTARLRLADPRHRLLQRSATVARDEHPGALVLGGWPPRLAGVAGPSSAGSLAEAGAGPRWRRSDPSRAGGARPPRPGRLRCTSPGRGAGRPSGRGRSSRRWNGRPSAPPPRRTRSPPAGRSVASASWGKSWLAQVAGSSRREHHPGDAEASPSLGGRLAGAGVHEREGQGQRVIDERPRPDEEPSLPPSVDWSLRRSGSSSAVHGTSWNAASPAPQASSMTTPEGERVASRTAERSAACSSRRHAASRSRRSARGSPPGASGSMRKKAISTPPGLAVERAPESPRRPLELGLPAIGLGPPDLGRPPVLQRGEHDEQHGERGQGQPQPAVLHLPVHDASVPVGAAPLDTLAHPIYSPYNEIATP